MANISDNLRDFNIEPTGIKNWKLGNNFNLTLSVILENQDQSGKEGVLKPIEKLQKEIIKMAGLDKLDKIELDNPYQAAGVYKYGRNNLHFSLINFLTHDLTYNSEFNYGEEIFKKYRECINDNKGYQNYRGEVKSHLQEYVNDFKSNNFQADIRWVYTDNCRDSINSISLQVYPDKNFILKIRNLKNKFSEKLPKWQICNIAGIESKLKAYPENNECRFVLNILRFMNIKKTELSDNVKDELKSIVREINKKHIKEPLASFSIKQFDLVESDPFSFNEYPVLKIRL